MLGCRRAERYSINAVNFEKRFSLNERGLQSIDPGWVVMVVTHG